MNSLAPRFEVRLSGTTLAADLADQVQSLIVETDLDLAGTFRLVLRNADNRLLDSALLDLGKTVEIHLGYGAELEPAFLGEVAAIEPDFPAQGAPTVTISGYDKSYRMRRSQPEPTVYTFLNDSLIAAEIAALNGLIPIVDPVPGLPEKTVQVESDMAFLKSRAEKYFFDVYVDWDRLYFQFPRPQTAAYVLEWGDNLMEFRPRIASAGLAGLQVIRGYNQELAQSIYSAAVAGDLDPANLIERLGSSALDLVSSLIRKGVTRQPVDNPLDATVLARSLLTQLLEGLYEGSGSCPGLPGLKAGRYVEIRGVGRRFSGTFRVRRVTHRIDTHGFVTTFAITQRSHGSLAGLLRKHLTGEPPPDQREPFYGVLVGTVEDNDEVRAVPPSLPLGRVKVSFPGLSDRFTSGWAPCVRPMAGSSAGFYALPDVGDQVLVAFEAGDVTRPYVLGGLWNGRQPPPENNLDGTNAKTVIVSRTGHRISFDDTAAAPKLTVADRSGSSLTFDPTVGSVTVAATGELVLTAAQGQTKITMDAQGVDVT